LKYPSEFRREAFELVRTSGRSREEVAQSRWIRDNSLRNWINTERDRRERKPDPDGLTESERSELKRLRGLTAQQWMDMEIRRQAAAQFGRETMR